MLEEHRFAFGEPHDVFHGVIDGLDEAGGGLGVFVAVFAGDGGVLFLVPVEVVLASLDAVDVVEADVEPDGGIKGAVLIDAQPGEFMLEVFGVGMRSEVAILLAAVGDGSRDSMNKLFYGVFSFFVLSIAVKILTYYHFCCQLAPEGGDFSVFLFKDDLSVVVGYLCLAFFPLYFVERMGLRV